MKHYPFDKAEAILAAHAIETRYVGGALQALNVWTDVSGAAFSEWVAVSATDEWLRNFLNY